MKIEHLDLRGIKKIKPAKMKNLRLKSLDLRGLKITELIDESTTKIIYLDEAKVDPLLIPVLRKNFEINPEKKAAE